MSNANKGVPDHADQAAYLSIHGSVNPERGGRERSDTPIEKNLAYGRQKGISGTPTLFLGDGQRVTAAIPADQLKKLLDGAR